MSDQSQGRSDMLGVTSYDLFLDITRGEQTFLSRAEIQFHCSAHDVLSFADLRAVSVRQATLNGEVVDVSAGWHEGRLELRPVRGQNVLVVEADFRYADAGGGQLPARVCTGSPTPLMAAAASTPRHIAAGRPACTAASTIRVYVRRSPSRFAPRPDGHV
jgi:hypothetical protein